MNNDEIIKFVKQQLSSWAFEDIKRASRGGSKMGAFILSGCLIDYLSSFYSGNDSKEQYYKEFSEKYLPAYNPEDLYVSMRCKLVHNYTEGGKFVFTDNHPELHCKKTNDNQLLLNLEDFMSDIEIGINNYFSDVDSDDNLKENIVKRYKEVGILGRRNITTLL